MRTVLRIAKRALVVVLGLAVVAAALLYGWSTWRLNRHYEVTVEQMAIPTDPASPRAYGQMTDEELHAIWSYLRTVEARGEKTPRQQAGPSQAPAADRIATAS